ncbi:MAG: [Lachnospiraceae bacterium]|nr:[FeFe] hydrogenase H-cluster maturation GTPase HydF [Lachnospiraceae bacterium]
MSLNATPSSERIHIGFFGKRNAGKSSLLNAVTGQDLAVVSEVPGTTTDPVRKAMELLPLGPVVMIDTPGLDDEGSLGGLRVKKTEAILKEVNIAIVVADVAFGLQAEEEALMERLEALKIPYIVALNKVDLEEGNENEEMSFAQSGRDDIIYVSAMTGYQIPLLKRMIAKLGREQLSERKIVGDLLQPGDLVVLVVPIDEAAPKGRLILPQQQTIREILDSGAIENVVKETELESTLLSLGKKPKLDITDSQVFGK